MDTKRRKSGEIKDRGKPHSRESNDSRHQSHWRTRLLLTAFNPWVWFKLLWTATRSLLLALTPKFQAPVQRQSVGSLTSSTAYLDGLRGVAAFIVLIHHFSKDPFPWLPWGWGSVRDDVPQHHFLQLPIVRIIHSGPSMVAVFFVISGFALSCSPLRYIRRCEPASLSSTLASSVFRRVMRLYTPTLATSLFMVVAVQLRLAPFPSDRPREANIFAELWSWLKATHWLANPFDLSFTLPRYDDNLWTIPVELRGSMVLFAVLLGLCRVRYHLRIMLEVAITAWLLSYGMWDVALFITGLVIAELHLEREATTPLSPSSLPVSTPTSVTKPRDRLSSSTFYSRHRHQVLEFLLLFMSLYLASAPLLGFATSPTYSFFSSITPPSWRSREVADRFIPTIAAPLLIYSVDCSARCKKFLTNPVGRYLGRVSFSLYLVHGPVRYTIYHPLMEAVMKGFGLTVIQAKNKEGKTEVWLKGVKWLGLDHLVGTGKGIDADRAKHQAQVDAIAALEPRFWASVFITWLILFPITMGLAEWFARVVDDGSVRMARKVEARFKEDGWPSTGDKREEHGAARRNNLSEEMVEK